MNKHTLIIVAVTVVVTLVLANHLKNLPLVDKLPTL